MRSTSRSIALTLAASLAVAATAVAQTQPTTHPAPATRDAFNAALQRAQPGDPVLTSFARLDSDLPSLPLSITPSADAARLVFSDRPEYFRGGDGIASQDTVGPGRVRFYAYHVPVMTDGKPKRVISMVENLGDKEATLTFSAISEPEIGGDYQAIAREAMHALLSGEGGGNTLTLAPHTHEVSQRIEAVNKPDLLVHTLADFTTDQPLRLTVAQVTATNDTEADIAAIANLPKLPLAYGKQLDSAGRGVFPTADYDVALANGATYDTASGASQVIVADGKADAWISGVDGITGEKTIDKGNYGVVYHMKLKWKSTDGRGLAVLMTSARFDSQWCNAVTASVRVNEGRHPGGVIDLPREAVRFHGIPEACVIQTFDAPADGAETTIELDYTPPGSCCLPTPILLVPIGR